MSVHTIVITIGRNVNGRPMSDARWSEFKQFVAERLGRRGIVLQAPLARAAADQVGYWQGEQEPAATYVALVVGDHLPWLRADLAWACRAFNQEAIGFLAVEGDDHLVTGES